MRFKKAAFPMVAGLMMAALIRPVPALAGQVTTDDVPGIENGADASLVTMSASDEAPSAVAGPTTSSADDPVTSTGVSEAPSTPDGWVDTDAGREYWKDGAPLKDEWLELNGARYRFSSDGAVLTGFQDIDGARYYFLLAQGSCRLAGSCLTAHGTGSM